MCLACTRCNWSNYSVTCRPMRTGYCCCYWGSDLRLPSVPSPSPHSHLAPTASLIDPTGPTAQLLLPWISSIKSLAWTQHLFLQWYQRDKISFARQDDLVAPGKSLSLGHDQLIWLFHCSHPNQLVVVVRLVWLRAPLALEMSEANVEDSECWSISKPSPSIQWTI